jgi:nucleotide-binding universal stress UspA family protein
MFTSKSKLALNILLTVDGSDYSQALTDLLTHIRWPFETIVHVLAFVPDRLPDMDSELKEQQIDKKVALERWRSWAAARILNTETASKLRAHHLAVKTEICEGQLPEVILARAIDLSIDLVAVDLTKFKELTEFKVKDSGPQSARQIPSLLVAQPSRQIRPLTTILVIDDSAEAWRAAEFICTLSLPQWAKTIVLNVIKEQAAVSSMPEPAGVQTLAGHGGAVLDLPDPTTAKVIERLHRCGTMVWSSYRCGDPVSEILSVAREKAADLIVMGAHRQRHRQPFYMDDVAQEIIESAPCSVLVIC